MVARIACLLWLVCIVAGCSRGSTPAAATTPTSTPAYRIDCVADSARPGGLAPEPGVTYATMVVDQTLRDYRLYQPPALDMTKPVPLVVVLHGTPIDAAGLEDVIHFQPEAAAAGFIAVYPDGCHEDWDETAGSSDVHFVSALLDRLESSLNVDRSRVYLVGTSAGGFMAYRLACDIPERFAAIASVAGSMLWTDCAPSIAVPIYELHGTADANVPYQGGRSTYHGSMQVQPVPDVIARWVKLDGCTGGPATSQVGIDRTQLWSRCSSGAAVRLDSVLGGHHTWFGSTYDPVPGEPDANKLIWRFFSSVPPRQAAEAYVALVRDYWAEYSVADADGEVAAACGILPSGPDASVVDFARCRSGLQGLLAIQQRFLADLGATPAPPRYATDTQTFLAHLPRAIADLAAMIAACDVRNAQEVVRSAQAYIAEMIPAVTGALDDVDPSVVHS